MATTMDENKYIVLSEDEVNELKGATEALKWS